ncbi:hypothetical protein [Streptomyces sp. ML-6]|uniref:hypothetical protein n=1 Tax=Streptomyces sp. ML-6 TaxID=2982693 RepID=UPI0024BF8B07|nr:hypothetical protein [Streptomyces sp. ML-6]MDK0520399.1 hypothetical protein [Streptomyces sp. ML-6]
MTPTTKRAIRTAIQAAVGLAAALPAIVAATGVPESLPWVAGALAIAAGISRVMALPVVEQWLDLLGIGLHAEEGRE